MRRLVLYISFLLFPLLITAQNVDFKASANAKKILLNSDFEVSFTLSNARAARSDFKFPSFRAFNVVTGPNEMQRTSITNGSVQSTLSYSFVLTPRKLGKYTINPALVKIDGQTYNTNALIIEVVEGNSNDERGDRPEIFLKAVTPVQQIYVGQQIPLDYKIFTTKNINSFNIITESEYQGFFAQEMRRYSSSVVKEILGDLQYSTKIMRRIALFPQQTGNMTIDPMKMQLGIAKAGTRNPRDFFFRPEMQRFNVSSEPLKLEVLPLPENPPASFTGAVGDYKASASVDQRSITTDDAFTFRISVVGNGDLKRVQAPPLQLDKAFELYEPQVVEERSQEINGEIQSRKVFEYVAVPKEIGQFTTQVEFTHFNPDSARYVTQRGEKYLLNVRMGNNAPRSIEESKEKIVTEDQELRFVKSDTDLRSKQASFFGSPLFYGLAGLPFLFLLGAIIVRRKRDEQNNIDPLVLKNRLARKLADKHLKVAKEHLDNNNNRAFNDEISKAMLGYVNDKLNIPNSELTKHNVIERLKSLKADDTEIERFMRVVRTSEMALFSRQSDDNMQTTYDDAIDVLVKIEQQIEQNA